MAEGQTTASSKQLEDGAMIVAWLNIDDIDAILPTHN